MYQKNLEPQYEELLDFLMQTAVATKSLILVTGHSLGAGLSTVFAPWLYYQIKSAGTQLPTSRS